VSSLKRRRWFWLLLIPVILAACPALAAEWKVRETEHFIYHYLEPWRATEEELETQDYHYRRIASALGVEYPGKIRFFWYPGIAEIQRHTGLNWEAFVRRDEIHATVAVIPHETVHVLMYVINPQGLGFLNEGIAVYLGDEGLLGPPLARRPVDVVAREYDLEGRFVPLRQLSGVLSLRGELAHPEADAAYVQSASFVKFLVERHGMSRFVEFYHQANPDNLSEVAAAVYGRSLEDLEAEWLQALRLRGLETARVTLGLGVVLVVAAAVRWALRYRAVQLRTVGRPGRDRRAAGAPARTEMARAIALLDDVKQYAPERPTRSDVGLDHLRLRGGGAPH